MSVVYCEDCGQYIDTDYAAEHFDDDYHKDEPMDASDDVPYGDPDK